MIYNKLFLASLMALVAQGTVQSAEYSSIFDGEYGAISLIFP